MQPQGVLQLLR